MILSEQLLRLMLALRQDLLMLNNHPLLIERATSHFTTLLKGPKTFPLSNMISVSLLYLLIDFYVWRASSESGGGRVLAHRLFEIVEIIA